MVNLYQRFLLVQTFSVLLVCAGPSRVSQEEDANIEEEPTGEADEAPATSTTTRPVESDQEGRSRGAIGIPTDPHSGIVLAYRAPFKFRRADPRLPAVLGSSKRSKYVDQHKEKYFAGLGVRLDNRHVLMDIDTHAQAVSPSRDDFNNFSVHHPPKEIDIATPPSIHQTTEDGKVELTKIPGNLLNGTNLAVFESSLPSNIPPVKLETNPHEFGKDCYVHGYGQIGIGNPGYNPNLGRDFWASDQRKFVKAPIMQRDAAACSTTNTCRMSVRDPYVFCDSAGAGSPIFCGQEQKLTYMAKYELNNPGKCWQTFDAYHIPRLVGAMKLPHLLEG